MQSGLINNRIVDYIYPAQGPVKHGPEYRMVVGVADDNGKRGTKGYPRGNKM